MFHGSYAFSLHDADIHKTLSSQPPPVFSLSYTTCECPVHRRMFQPIYAIWYE